MATSTTAHDRAAARSYQQILDTDTRPVPNALRMEHPGDFGTADLPADRYFRRDIHEREVERIWKRDWQFACREEAIPEVGDTEVYDIADISILLVRSSPSEIKAYYNACLHRGRQIRDRGGRMTELQCPFHGFCWRLDGSLKRVPAQWDFPHVDAERFRLPEVRVGTWAGFVFVNLDPEAEPLQSYLGDLPSHFESWALEDRYTEAHVVKTLPCNWKVAQEAFMESYHIVTTHPQVLTAIGDTQSQYDVFGNWSRAITPRGVPSEHLRSVPTEQEMFDSMVGRGLDDPPIATVPEGASARSLTAAGSRERLRTTIGDRADELCDAELVDSFYYTVFPNFHPWGAYNRLIYRFRPNGNDPETSLFEILLLAPFKGERPAPARVHRLGLDDSFMDAPELGQYGRVFEQDAFNLGKVQRGLHTLVLTKPGVTLARYQETKIRHFYRMYDERMSD
jgi:phenylpropionate dioxygenase-like ring-hydroxylating dioxygenase large terminal subunit